MPCYAGAGAVEVPCWDEFTLRYLAWPSLVQVVIIILLIPISATWKKQELSQIRLLVQHVGTKHNAPRSPHFYVGLMVMQLCFSALAVVLWVHRTYVRETTTADHNIETVMTVFFTLAYLVRLTKREFHPMEALTIACLNDVFTTAPFFLGHDKDQWLSLAFLRIYRALDAFQEIESTGILDLMPEFPKACGILLLQALCLVVVLGGCVYILEVLGEIPGFRDSFIVTDSGDSLSFIQIFYWTFTTISTVGYGDFAPKTMLSRLFICGGIVVGVAFFSTASSSLLELKDLLNTGRGAYRKRRRTSHVIVIGGGVSHRGQVLQSFLKELFGFDNKDSWPDVVMMSTNAKDASLQQLFDESHPEIRKKLFYFIGSPMIARDTQRVAIQSASLVYVLADISATDKAMEDGSNLLRALSIKKLAPGVALRLMILRSENKSRAINAGIDPHSVFSVDLMKATFMAHCCRCPGFITVVSNLTDSHDVHEGDWGDEEWEQNYFFGSNNAIYGLQAAGEYLGLSVTDFVTKCFLEAGVLVFAAQSAGNVMLNPAHALSGRAVRTDDVFFAIARDPDDIEKVAGSNETWLDTFKQSKLQSKLQSKDSFKRSDSQIPVPQKKKQETLEQRSRNEEEASRDNVRELAKSGGHIVLTSCNNETLSWLQIGIMLDTLRKPSRQWEHKPVLVLATDHPPRKLVQDHPDTIFMIGSSHNVADLEDAQVNMADVVMLLAGDAPSGILPELRDRNSVVVANTLDLILKDTASSAFVIYELHEEHSVSFLPGAGAVGTNEDSTEVKMQATFAAGHLFSLSFMGEMLGREYYVPSTMELLQALLMPTLTGTHIPFLVPVSDQYIGATFGTLFEALLRADDPAIVLAIYRQREEVGKDDCSGYVVSNPKAELNLVRHDKVYVLASEECGRHLLKSSLSLDEDDTPVWRKSFNLEFFPEDDPVAPKCPPEQAVPDSDRIQELEQRVQATEQRVGRWIVQIDNKLNKAFKESKEANGSGITGECVSI